MSLYYIEVTDTFCGEANYSWVTRHLIKGSTESQAIERFSKLSDTVWCWVDRNRYDNVRDTVCLFIEEYCEDYHKDYSFITDDRVTK
jgi:hypothetical protein